MKKIFMAIVLCLVCTVSFGQLNIKTQQEVANYEVVFKWWNGWGNIRYFYDTEQFVLLGASDNNYEESMHNIVLGNSKESAIESLKQLGELKQTFFKDVLVTYGLNNKQTKIYRGGNGLVFETEYIVGISYALCYLNVNKAILAIENFNI